ncbi:DEAD/DEAH box helicase [Patescibacteria group bacterium]
MTHTACQFRNVVVVADGPNIFTEQLTEAGIVFRIVESVNPDTVKTPPDLVLTVNKGRRTAEDIKSQYPDAQVIVVQGGRKQYAPRITVVHGKGKDNYDVLWYQTWDQFIEIISKPQPRRPKAFVPSGEPDQYSLIANIDPCPPLSPEVEATYDLMLRISEHYLTWYLQWLSEIGGMIFKCSFNFPKRRKRIARVTLPNNGQFTHWGLPVFSEEAEAIFLDDRDNKHNAVVESVRDEEITFVFTESLPRQTANNLVSVKLKVANVLQEMQREVCWQAMSHPEECSRPLKVMAGQCPNDGVKKLTTLHLTLEQARNLRQDESQTHALAVSVDNRSINLIHGPAGTGKTCDTAWIVKQFAAHGKVTLLVSHSNQGLDTLLDFVARSIEREDVIFRLGNNAKNVTSQGSRFHRSERFSRAEVSLHDDEQREDKHLSKDEVHRINELLGDGQSVILACTMASFLVDRTLVKLLTKMGVEIDVTIIDEASRGYLFEVLPVVNATKERVVFIGDPDQLGNLELSPDVRRYLRARDFTDEQIALFGNGWFNTVVKQELFPVDLLMINRRSLPVVCRLVSNLFYDDRVIPGRFDAKDPGQFTFIDTKDAQHNEDKQIGTSFCNRKEANIVVRLIVWLLSRGVRWEDIAIITPYRAQIILIRNKLRGEILFNKRLAKLRKRLLGDRQVEGEAAIARAIQDQVEQICLKIVNTVDAFQGSQRKIIVCSMVTSNTDGRIGFNRNVNRLRVAFSRAADHLYLIANSRTFLESDFPEVHPIFEQSIAYARELGTYQEVT